MQLIIDIKSDAVSVKSGISKKGKPYSITEQQGWVTLPSGETRRINLALEADTLPHVPGQYALNIAESIYVDAYGQLALGRVKLAPFGARKAA